MTSQQLPEPARSWVTATNSRSGRGRGKLGSLRLFPAKMRRPTHLLTLFRTATDAARSYRALHRSHKPCTRQIRTPIRRLFGVSRDSGGNLASMPGRAFAAPLPDEALRIVMHGPDKEDRLAA
jgi:hypothetical protein